MATQTTTQSKKTPWLWIILAVLLAALALGVLWWWKFAKPPVSGACKAEDMSLSIGTSQTVDGMTYTRAVVTNNGSTSCTIEGHPVVSLLDKKGENHVTGDAMHNNSYPAEKVVLGPRDKAHAVLGLPEADSFRGVCSDTMATLRLYLPVGEILPGIPSLSTPFEHKACPGFFVTVFRAGA
jgi:flagellar basal body-associated protein FliL